MNILMIGESHKFGGASEIMEILAKGLENDGHAVTLVYGYNYGNYNVEPEHYVLFNNILLRRINNRLRPWMERFNLSNLYVYWYINFLIKKKKIDIVHFHALQGGYISLSDVRRICKKQRVVWTIHDTWPITGGCMYYWDCQAWKNAACRGCKENDLQMKYRNTTVNWNRKKKTLQQEDIYYVAPSGWMLSNMQQSFLSGEKIILIENGINLETFKPLDNIEDIKLKYGVNISKKILMFSAGSIRNSYKGWKYLRDALFQLNARGEYELLVVGKEAEDIDNLDISMVKMGFIQEKHILNELYNMADVFILPSVQDNFPTVTLEAQAAGTPVLAFAIGGIKEQVTPETGWLLERVNAEAIKTAIEDIFNDKNWRDEIRKKGKAARERSEILYGERLMTEKYEEVYVEKKKHAENKKSGKRKSKNIL